MKRSAFTALVLIAFSALGWQSNGAFAQSGEKATDQKHASLYPSGRNAKKDIANAVATAKTRERRVLLVYGADWCSSCHDLEETFQSVEVKPVLDAGFVVVHIDLGQGDQNIDILKAYQVPLTGIPAFSVLDQQGKLLHSQDGGAFEESDAKGVLRFLNQWSTSASAQQTASR